MNAKFWVLILAGFFLTACGGPADEAAPADDSSAGEAMEDEEEGADGQKYQIGVIELSRNGQGRRCETSGLSIDDAGYVDVHVGDIRFAGADGGQQCAHEAAA